MQFQINPGKSEIDLFKQNNTHYLTIADYITDYFGYNQLNNQTPESVINTIIWCSNLWGMFGI